MRKATEQERTKLDSMLKAIETELLRLELRFRYLSAFLKELHGRTQGKNFDARNEVLWHWFWDSHDMAVIDLVSLSKSMLGGGGFFNQLKNHIVQLRAGASGKFERRAPLHVNGPRDPAERRRLDNEMHDHRQARFDAETANSLGRLFPALKPGKAATPKDIDDLKDRVADALEGMKDTRHLVAHRHEHSGVRRPPAELGDVRRALSAIEEVIADLRFVSFGSQVLFEIQPLSDPETTSRDLVDLMLVGTINQVVESVGMSHPDGSLRWYWQFREKKAPPMTETK